MRMFAEFFPEFAEKLDEIDALYEEKRSIDEHLCMTSIPRRNLTNADVIEVLADLMSVHGTPEYLRSDSGGEFIAKKAA